MNPNDTYFMLNSECYLVEGDLRGAIYNLHTGSVFSIGPELTQIVALCEQRVHLGKIAERQQVSVEELFTTLGKLQSLHLGMFHENRPLIEKLKPALTKRMREDRVVPRILNHLYLELTGACNLDCAFCDKGSIEPRKSIGCHRWPISPQERLTNEKWLDVVRDAGGAECPTLQIIGGEPLLEKSLVFDIIETARASGFTNILLSTNGLLLNSNDFQFLSRHPVSVAIQIYSSQSEVHDRITRDPGNFECTVNIVQQLKEAGITFSFDLVVLKDNQDHWEETLSFFSDFEPLNIIYDMIRPSTRSNNDFVPDQLIYQLYAFKKEDRLTSKIHSEEFFHMCQGNPFWDGRLAVTPTGDVLPDPTSRTEIIGNIKDKGLKEMLRDGDMDVYWDMSKDHIDVCQGCEYRYACPDLRALEKETQEITSKTKYCTYDPSTGEWMSLSMPDFLSS